MWEDTRVWAQWNFSSDRHLGYLQPVSCVFTSLASLALTIGSGCSLMAARWQVFFSFLRSLRAHKLTIDCGHNCQWLWHPLFTDVAGTISFLILQRLSWAWAETGYFCTLSAWPNARHIVHLSKHCVHEWMDDLNPDASYLRAQRMTFDSY